MQQGRVTNIPTVASLLAAFFAISVTGGVLGAGLAMPAAAAFGTVTKSTIGLYDDLPAELTSVVPNQQTQLLASDGKTVIATLYLENRIVVPLSQIAPIMRKAQVAIEDKRFYQHGGVDLQGMGAVAAGVLAGKEARGASTLTQQYVKVTLETAARRNNDSRAEKAASAVNAARKLQEMRYATEVEKVKTKDQILQDYLNLVYFGDQAYGVEAAARHFFGTTAAKLTLPQAATLAGQVQNPGTVNAIVNPQGTLKRRNTVLFAMHQQGIITDKDYRAALNAPLGVHKTTQPSSCAASQYPFICEYTLNWLKQQPALGDSEGARMGNLLNNGYRIVTTFDPRLLHQAQEIMAQHVRPGDYKPVGASSVTLDPNTGKVRSLILSTGYSIRPGIQGRQGVNWAVDSLYGANHGVAIGSTMKLFAVVAALENGWGPDSMINNIRTQPATYYASDFPGGCGTVKPWTVSNTEGDDNPTSTTLRIAMTHSINTAFAALVQQIGPCKVRDVATAMGLHQAANGQPISKNVSDITLGSGGSSPLNLAQAYGVIAAKGKLCPELPIESVTDTNGKKVDLKLPGCKQVIPEKVANEAADILTSVISDGTGKGLGLAGRVAGGKTGTSDKDQSWFVGITPQLSTAVWVGNPDAFGQFQHVWINGRYYKQVFGADVAGPIWQQTMNAASQGMPALGFGGGGSAPAPAAAPPNPANGTVPDVSGMSPDQAISTLQAAGYSAYVAKRVATSAVSPGTVAYTVPAAGSNAGPGTSVGLRVARSSYSSGTSAQSYTGGSGQAYTGTSRGTTTTKKSTATKRRTTKKKG